MKSCGISADRLEHVKNRSQVIPAAWILGIGQPLNRYREDWEYAEGTAMMLTPKMYNYYNDLTRALHLICASVAGNSICEQWKRFRLAMRSI